MEKSVVEKRKIYVIPNDFYSLKMHSYRFVYI